MNQIETALSSIKKVLSTKFDSIINEKQNLNTNSNINTGTYNTSTTQSKDLLIYLNSIIQNPSLYKSYFNDYYFTLNTLFYIRYIRNKWAHQGDLNLRQIYKFYDEAEILLSELYPNSTEHRFIEFQRRLILQQLSGDFQEYIIKHSDDIINWKINCLESEVNEKKELINIIEKENDKYLEVITKINNDFHVVKKENEELKSKILCLKQSNRQDNNQRNNKNGNNNDYNYNNVCEYIDISKEDHFSNENMKNHSNHNNLNKKEEYNFSTGVVYNEFIESMEIENDNHIMNHSNLNNNYNNSKNDNKVIKDDKEMIKEIQSKYTASYVIEEL